MKVRTRIQAQDNGWRWHQRGRPVQRGLCCRGDYGGWWWVFGKGSSKKVLKDHVAVVGGGVGMSVDSRVSFLVLEASKVDVLPDLFHGFGIPSGVVEGRD